MKLELDDEDLRPAHKMCNASKTTFRKFTKAAQRAIVVVGKGTYFTPDRSNYNVIYPPQKKEQAHEPESCCCAS